MNVSILILIQYFEKSYGSLNWVYYINSLEQRSIIIESIACLFDNKQRIDNSITIKNNSTSSFAYIGLLMVEDV
jgi:hypothetical protein